LEQRGGKINRSAAQSQKKVITPRNEKAKLSPAVKNTDNNNTNNSSTTEKDVIVTEKAGGSSCCTMF